MWTLRCLTPASIDSRSVEFSQLSRGSEYTVPTIPSLLVWCHSQEKAANLLTYNYLNNSAVVRCGTQYIFFGCAKVINMNKLISVNEEIESVSLYSLRPLVLHGYVLPFVLLYAGWLYVWVAVLGFSDYVEAGCIGFVIIGLLQVVCSLLCHWFVSVRCLLTCNRVRLVF